MEMHTHVTAYDTAATKRLLSWLWLLIFMLKCVVAKSHYSSYATVDYVMALPPICTHIFHLAPDKVEVKDQNTQTKTLEIKDQQVQTDSTAQNQGTCT